MRYALRSIGCFAVIALCQLATSWSEEPSQPAPAPERIAQLIQQLDADTFAAQEEASQALAKLGESAEQALVKELESPRSREVEQRATALLKKIRLQHLARNAVRLDDLLQDIRLSKQAKLDTVALEAKLQRLVEVLTLTTDAKLALPVRFAEVAVQPPNDSHANGALAMGESVSITFAQKSILIADTAIQVTHATNCIIIARFAVEVSHSQNCLIISGHNVDSSIDHNSMLLSGSKCNVSIAHDAVIAAPQVQTGIPKSVQFVNCGGAAANRARPNDNSRWLETPGLVLELPQKPNPLADKITLTYLMGGQRQNKGFVLFQRAGQGGEYVVRVGQEPRNPDGSELPELKGWTLRYAGRQTAVFANDQQECCLSVSPPR